MSMVEHVESLKSKHADLDHLIELEEHRPLPNPSVIMELKRLKLRIKDEIAQLVRQ